MVQPPIIFGGQSSYSNEVRVDSGSQTVAYAQLCFLSKSLCPFGHRLFLSSIMSRGGFLVLNLWPLFFGVLLIVSEGNGFFLTNIKSGRMTLVPKPRLLLRCWSWLALMWQARLLLASVSLLQGLYSKRHPTFCTHFHFLSQLGNPFNHSLFRQIHRTQTPNKKYSKLRTQLGKPYHQSFRHLRDLHWAVMGFHSRMYNMGEVLCRKKVFYLKLGIWFMCACYLITNNKFHVYKWRPNNS